MKTSINPEPFPTLFAESRKGRENKKVMKKDQSNVRRIYLLLFTLFVIVNLWPVNAQLNTEPIETIKVGGVAEVFFTYGEQTEITKEISGRIIPEVIVEHKDGVLRVTTKGEAQGEVVKIHVSGSSLKEILVDDRAQFHGTNTLHTKVLKIISSEYGSVDLSVQSDELYLNMDGGDIIISGTTNNCFIEMNESEDHGTIDSSNLKVNNL